MRAFAKMAERLSQKSAVGVAVIALALAAPQVAALFRDSGVTRPGGNVHWLEVNFADATCAAEWWVSREAEPLNPWSSHPSDNGQKRVCTSQPFRLDSEPYLVVQYAGNTGDRHVRAELDLGADGEMNVPLTLGNNARHGWLVSFEELPPRARNRTARLVIIDENADEFGWLAIRRVGQSTTRLFGPTTNAAFPSWLVMALCPALVLLGVAVFLRFRIAGGLILFSGLALLFCRLRTFYQWDEWVLLLDYANGLSPSKLLAYNGHFEPLFLACYAAAAWMARGSYGWLQLTMMTAHVGVALLLITVLRRHGFAPALAAAMGALFAASWVQVGVAIWFMEFAFLATTALTLIALLCAIQYVESGRFLRGACIAASLAPLVNSGGLVTPWIIAAYFALFKRDGRRLAAAFAGIGVAALMVALIGRGLWAESSAAVPDVTLAQRLIYLAKGTLQGSILALIGLRGNLGAGNAVLVFALGIILVCARWRPWTSWQLRSAIFGALWLAAAYGLQALMRADSGSGQALSFHYAYFGMTAAAFLLATVAAAIWGTAGRELRPRAGQAAVVAVALCAAVVLSVNARKFLKRADHHEREYYEMSYQQYALMTAELQRARHEDAVTVDGPMLKSSHPYLTLREFATIVDFLNGQRDTRSISWVDRSGQELASWAAVIGNH